MKHDPGAAAGDLNALLSDENADSEIASVERAKLRIRFGIMMLAVGIGMCFHTPTGISAMVPVEPATLKLIGLILAFAVGMYSTVVGTVEYVRLTKNH